MRCKPGFLLPVRVLSRLFRRLFRAALTCLLARLRAVEPSNAETLAAALSRQRDLRASYERIERSADLLRPIIAAKDVAEDEGGRRQIAATVFDSFAPQLDLSFAAAAYGLVGLFLGSFIGELLVAALLPRHRFAR